MRTRTLLALIPLLLILGVSSAFALKISPISRFRMHVMCGASESTYGDYTGCNKACGKMTCNYYCDNTTFQCQKIVHLTTEQPGKLPGSAVHVQVQDSVPASLVTPVGGPAAPVKIAPVPTP